MRHQQQKKIPTTEAVSIQQVYKSLATLLLHQRTDEMLSACERLLADRPNDETLWHYQGAAYRAKGDHNRAIAAYDRALQINPANWEVLYHLGTLMMEHGHSEQALGFFESVIHHNPEHLAAMDQMTGVFMRQQDYRKMTAAALRTVRKAPENDEYWLRLKWAMERVDLFAIPSDFKDFLIEQTKGLSRQHIGMTAVASYTLFYTNQQFHDCSLQVRDHGVSGLDQAAQEIGFIEQLKDPLFEALLNYTVVNSMGFELFIKAVRHAIISTFSKDGVARSLTASESLLVSGLAKYFFRVEYLPDVSQEEDGWQANVALQLEALLPAPFDMRQATLLLVWAMYAPLHKLPHIDAWRSKYETSPVNEALRDLFKLTHDDLAEEARIKSELPSLGRVADTVSQKVQEQYEENPYPRWDILTPVPQLQPSRLIAETLPFMPSVQVQVPGAPEILIAGCGTGKHSLTTGSFLPTAHITSVDISRSSLAYAVRKARELHLEKQHQFMHADILELESLGRRFDIIESSGVLHHMKDPMEGWRILNQLLKPGGLMRIGLYSRTARRDIIRAREEIAQKGYPDTLEGIRRYREECINDQANQFTHSADFYTTSSLRDLLFHRQEHQFTIPQIKQCLADLGLQFLGFTGGTNLYERYNRHLPFNTDFGNLDNWAMVEEKEPYMFFAMYQFWCYKPTK